MNNVFQALMRGGNPTTILQQAARSNPQMGMALQMIQGKSPQQLQQMACNMCRERGTSPDAVLKQLGIK